MIITGPVLALSFQLLNCTKIDGKHYHFYDATKECYGMLWNFGFIVIVVTSLIWTGILYLVFQQSISQRENEYNQYRSLVNKYKSNVWWYEYISFCEQSELIRINKYI